MIQVHNLKYSYPNGEKVLAGIDLTVSSGEYLLVCGANGSGKSTLAYTFNGLIPHHFGGILEGSVKVSGLDTAFHPPAELFSHAGLVLQNSDAQLFNATVEDELAFGLESLGMAPEEISRRVRKAAAEFEIEHLLSFAPSRLSGGERKLVSIAAVLGAEPPLVILDEPFANLDWAGSENLRRILGRVHQRGTTVVVVEHVLEDLPAELNRCVLIDRGRIKADVSAEAMMPILREARLIPRYPAPLTHGAGQPLLTLENLKAEREGRVILRGVSFSIRQGENVALVGRNGCGKTTLVKHLNGLLKPSAGKVTYKEHDVTGLGPSRMASLVGISFQNPNDQFFTFSVGEELLAGPRALGKTRNARFEEMLDLFKLKNFWDRSPYRLSEGEKKRVAICSILAMEPEMLVLDEPTAGQDGHFRESLASSLNRLAETGLTTLVVTHDLEFASAVASRWILLEEGVVASDGSASEVRSAVKTSRTYEQGAGGGGHERP
ncbi:MAG: ABC transporter ATP-binding protein [Desulfatiglandaceae bacterium]